jgi:methionyl-tRNA synthetase
MCGHPNNFDELISPRSTTDPDAPVTYREAEILVLPMERYRKELTAFYAARGAHLRPRTARFLREALSRPLPDFPVTYPISYGLPSPFPGTEGQAINAWVEGIPAVMYCTSYGQGGADGRNLWLAENDVEIIYFIGSDIVYFWGLTHLALLMAHEGRYALPDMIVSNEFYELDNEKFSTTRGHVVYLGELLEEFPRDIVRFHLALTGPEHQRTNFSRSALAKISQNRLVGPWNRIAKALNSAGAGEEELPVSDGARSRAAAVLSRFATLYELTGYSPAEAADLVVAQLERLDAAVSGDAALGDLFLEVRALITGASPILVDLAEQARRTGGWDGSFDPSSVDVPSVRPFPVPVFDDAHGMGARTG